MTSTPSKATAGHTAELLNDGGPAFPCEGGPCSGLHSDPGMSMRDYFAAAALTGLLSYPESHLNCGTAERAASSAFEIADAMIRARAAAARGE